MAGLTWIFFGICVVTCSAQFGYNPRDNPFFRPKSLDFQRRPDPLLGGLQNKDNDNKCFTLARRPFYMTRPMQYPCNKRLNGVPVAHSFMGPLGPMCVSLFREPVHRYYRVEMCCPGFTADRNGRCTIPTRGGNRVPDQMQQQQQQQQQRNMMSIAAEMRNMMMMRARATMARRRAMMMNNMHRRMMMNGMHRRMMMNGMRRRMMMMPRRPPMFPPMAPMFARMMGRPGPRMFRRPQLPVPRPVQRPPVNGRFVKIIRHSVTQPMILSTILRVPFAPSPLSVTTRQPARMVLSNRAPDERIGLEKLHPIEQAIPPPPEIPVPQDFQPPEEIPQNTDNADGFFGSEGFGPDGGFQPSEVQAVPDIHVDLPDEPVEMPKLIVEQAPLSEGQQTSCIMTLNTAVKSCLKQNNIDVPDVMSAFGPFNEEMSSVLCEREEAIFTCISEALNECNASEDAQVARDMLLETADTVRSMCVHREIAVDQSDSVQPDQLITAQSNEATSVGDADTVATVENVDASPTDVNSGTQAEQITIIEDTAPPADETIKQAIKHEVHVQEVKMKEYYLPLLIGSGLGFVLLVLVSALLICCCCRRRIGKKMKMAKEPEKPPICDEIYTIGLAPPTYEVNGIPPMYYEEAKGEKITSKSPSVVQGSEEEGPEGDGTKM